jgi:hypothetical protein
VTSRPRTSCAKRAAGSAVGFRRRDRTARGPGRDFSLPVTLSSTARFYR